MINKSDDHWIETNSSKSKKIINNSGPRITVSDIYLHTACMEELLSQVWRDQSRILKEEKKGNIKNKYYPR